MPRLSSTKVFAGILLFGLLALTARPAVDPDLWWHLSTGQWIFAHRQIPHVDPFSFTRAGYPWVSHEWLSEVVFYAIWRWTGCGGLIVFSALITTAGFLLLFLRCPGPRYWAAAATVFGALASAPTWGVRPQMFTFLLASALLWLLERAHNQRAHLLAIPPLFLVWLNLHAGFAIGPVLLLAFAFGLVWEAASGASAWKEVRSYLLCLFLVLLACLALVPLNPSGIQLYRYPLDVLRSAEMRLMILEWRPPDFHRDRYLPLLLLCLALLTTFGSLLPRPKGRVLVPLLAMYLAALDAARHIPLFVLLAIPVIAEALPVHSSRWQLPQARPRQPTRLSFAFRGVILILLALFAAARWVILAHDQTQIEAQLFPAQAVQALRLREAPSRVFAYYDWGGYVIWKLYPGFRVWVDGRADLYGGDMLRQFQTTIRLQPGWKQILKDWGVTTVLLPPTTAVAQALSIDPAWHAEYHDAQAVIYVRNDADAAGTLCRRNRPAGSKKVKNFVSIALLNLRN